MIHKKKSEIPISKWAAVISMHFTSGDIPINNKYMTRSSMPFSKKYKWSYNENPVHHMPIKMANILKDG